MRSGSKIFHIESLPLIYHLGYWLNESHPLWLRDSCCSWPTPNCWFNQLWSPCLMVTFKSFWRLNPHICSYTYYKSIYQIYYSYYLKNPHSYSNPHTIYKISSFPARNGISPIIFVGSIPMTSPFPAIPGPGTELKSYSSPDETVDDTLLGKIEVDHHDQKCGFNKNESYIIFGQVYLYIYIWFIYIYIT